jgi:hypothetical protein
MIGELFLNHSVSKLNQMTGYIDTCVSKLDSSHVWSHDYGNSIGNLVLHLCGNVRQWIGWSVGGLPDIRQRDLEFSTKSTGELLPMLHKTVAEAVVTLENLPPDRLTERVPTQDGDRFVLEVIYQVVGHFQQHTGQIIFVTKMLTGADLQFYKKSP